MRTRAARISGSVTGRMGESAADMWGLYWGEDFEITGIPAARHYVLRRRGHAIRDFCRVLERCCIHAEPDRTMPLRRGALCGARCVSLRDVLPLLELPTNHRLRLQTVCRHSPRAVLDCARRAGYPHLRRRRAEFRRPLPEMRFATLFGGARRDICSRGHGHIGRRAIHTAFQTYFRGVEGAMAFDNRRPASI